MNIVVVVKFLYACACKACKNYFHLLLQKNPKRFFFFVENHNLSLALYKAFNTVLRIIKIQVTGQLKGNYQIKLR